MADRKLTGDPAQEPDLKQDESAAGALIEPHSIAIVGASERSRWSTAIVGNVERYGFAGDLYLVNPRGGSIDGRPVAQSCAAVGAAIDLGILLVPANAAICRRVTLYRRNRSGPAGFTPSSPVNPEDRGMNRRRVRRPGHRRSPVDGRASEEGTS